MPLLFALTLFVSALLLFMVQPMIGRMILPLLGGSPAAWNTCMVFFQFVLLLGYFYAHKLPNRISPRRQIVVHLGVLLAAVAVIALAVVFGERHTPIAIVKSLSPQSTAYPMFGVLALLTVAIGVPFFAVSTTAPLLQTWFAKTDHQAAKDPYFLYAASNLGSLISLLAYPLITEPRLTLAGQAWLWAVGFVLFIGCVAYCGRRGLARTPQPDAITHQVETPNTLGKIVKWTALAFVPSSLMLGVTTFMTTDIASIPLLWVIPLALYLLTFIIAFSRTPKWFRIVLGNIAPVVTLLLIYIIITQHSFENVFWLLALHLVAYFCMALMCHSELAHERPEPSKLTGFYLWISVGGVLGGIFNALIAPLLFPLAYEYTIALGVGCLLVPKFTDDKPIDARREGTARLWDIFVPVLMLVGVAMLTASTDATWFFDLCNWLSEMVEKIARGIGIGLMVDADKIRDGLLWAVPLIICFFFIDRPLRFGLCVLAVLLVGEIKRSALGHNMVTERSFFGILKVQEERSLHYEFLTNDNGEILTNSEGKKYKVPLRDSKGVHVNTPYARTLVHGTTLHGKQGQVPFPLTSPETGTPLDDAYAGLVGGLGLGGFDWRQEPLTYYHRTGPVGHMFAVTKERFKTPNVAMVGLGTGSVAAYCDKSLRMTFYEIDPLVRKLVEPDTHFTYISDARKRGGTVDFVIGDARLKLEENTDAKYDLLLVDAFSSDSIPVHLLTREALQLYLNRMTDNGMLALHISNKFVNLEYVVSRLAEELNLTALVFNDSWTDRRFNPDGSLNQYIQEAAPGKTQSSWVVLAPNPERLRVFAEDRFQTVYPYLLKPSRFGTDGKETFETPKVNMWQRLKSDPVVKPWTDDYADVLMVMTLPEVQKARRLFGLPLIAELAE